MVERYGLKTLATDLFIGVKVIGNIFVKVYRNVCQIIENKLMQSRRGLLKIGGGCNLYERPGILGTKFTRIA